MTRTEAEAFLARNPRALEHILGFKRDGVLNKMDASYLFWGVENEADAFVNLITVAKAMGWVEDGSG